MVNRPSVGATRDWGAAVVKPQDCILSLVELGALNSPKAFEGTVENREGK